MLPALLGAAGLALAAPSALDWFLDLPERYGSDTLSRSRRNLRAGLQMALPNSRFDDLNMSMGMEKLFNEREVIGNMASYGPIGQKSQRTQAIDDQFLMSQIGRDYGQEIARIARTSGPSFTEIAASLGINPGELA